MTAPSPTSARRSGSIRNSPALTTGVVSRTRPRASTTAPSPTYGEAIRLNPKYDLAYRHRGIVLLYSGAPAKAQADFQQAADINPKSAYHAIWLEIAERRQKRPSRLAQTTKQVDMKAFTAPVVRLFLGEATPAELRAIAEQKDAKPWERCDASFYVAEFVLLNGRKAEALRLYRQAVKDCPPTYQEWTAAHAALRSLGVRP